MNSKKYDICDILSQLRYDYWKIGKHKNMNLNQYDICDILNHLWDQCHILCNITIGKYKNMNLNEYDICDILSQLWDQCPPCAHSHTLHCCCLSQKLVKKLKQEDLIMMKIFLNI